jgi:hypothetical protein
MMCQHRNFFREVINRKQYGKRIMNITVDVNFEALLPPTIDATRQGQHVQGARAGV